MLNQRAHGEPPAEGQAVQRCISRREFLRLAAAASGSAALAACAAPVPPESLSGARPAATLGPGEKIQLVYQDWRTDWFPPMAQEMLDQFHATHPNIRVFYTLDPENLEEKMMADFRAGTAPDVFQGCCSFFPIWAQKGYTLDLRPYVRADLDQATIEDWDPAQYNALFTLDGVQYGLPKYHGALALYYNKDLFDQYRMTYPDGSWTYDDYLEAMKRLTHDRTGDGITDVWGSMVDISWDRIQVHVNAWGGHFVDPEDPTRCMMGEPPALQAMEWIRARMWEDQVMPTSLDVQKVETRQAFSSGQLAMVEDGSWALRDILATSEFAIGVAPMPAGPVRQATLATTDGFSIYAGTKYPEASWELLKFLVGKDYGLAMAKAHFLQPARESLVSDWVGYIVEEFPAKAKGMGIEAFADGHRKGYSVVAEVFANMEPAQRIAYEAWDSIFTLGQGGVEIMASACRQIEAAQKTAG